MIKKGDLEYLQSQIEMGEIDEALDYIKKLIKDNFGGPK